jgi:carboxyl-terminal processing protease
MTHLANLTSALKAVFCTGAIATTTALSWLHLPITPAAQASFQDSPKALLDEAWQIVNREYVDPTFNRVDWLAVRQELLSRHYTSTKEAYEALREALERLNDPYTRFLDPRQYQVLTNQTSGELSGIGLRLQINEQTKALTVVEPIENSPASAAGIQRGDRIVAIDGKPTQGMTVEDASRLIQGEVGTQITLRIERQGGAAMDMQLTRARIELANVHSRIKQEGNTRVGYIQLTEFSSHAPEQMRQAIQTLLEQKVDGFVLDLRGNPGGLLSASIDISRMWLDNGTIVRTVDRAGIGNDILAEHSALTQLPLVVLVNGNSASSSEILTGALKDNQRAIVVGSPTFGKALVQSVHALSDGSGLAVTISHYYTPGGTDISHRGITPNVRVDLTEQQQRRLSGNHSLLATNADPQYQEAVTALRTTISHSQMQHNPAQPLSVGQDYTDSHSN